MKDNHYCKKEAPVILHNSSFHSTVKLFDFGLARIMPESDDPSTDVFDMSGAGTPR